LAFILVLAVLLVVILGRIWKAAIDRGGPGPAEPFRIAGNFYYVGTDAVSAFLFTGPEGHVLLDGGYPNIKDVKVLLNSIPRRDVAGGLAALQQASGAQLWSSESSAVVIASGGDDPDTAVPVRMLVQFGIAGYPPAHVDRRFKDGETIRLGPIALTAHITGGSSRGCTSWSFPVHDGDRVLNVVSACPVGLTPFVMRYPEQRDDIERSIRRLRSLPADIWVTSQSRAWDRYRKFVASATAKNPADAFIDPDGYRAYLDNAESVFHQGNVY
jgi:metallo-beta-lactamase class B